MGSYSGFSDHFFPVRAEEKGMNALLSHLCLAGLDAVRTFCCFLSLSVPFFSFSSSSALHFTDHVIPTKCKRSSQSADAPLQLVCCRYSPSSEPFSFLCDPTFYCVCVRAQSLCAPVLQSLALGAMKWRDASE